MRKPIDTHPTLDPAYVRRAIASAGISGDTRDAARFLCRMDRAIDSGISAPRGIAANIRNCVAFGIAAGRDVVY